MLKFSTNNTNTPIENRILDSAMIILQRDGYTDTSLANIANMASLSRSGLNHYYASKFDLTMALFDRSKDRLKNAFVGLETMDAKERIEHFTKSVKEYRDEIAFRAVIKGEAFPEDHPFHERAAESMETATSFIRQTFPELPDPYIFADIFESILVNWLFDPSLDIAAVLYEAYLALTSSDNIPPSEISDTPREGWLQELLAIHDSFIFSIREKSGLDLIERNAAREKAILDSTLKEFSKTGTFKGILNSVAKDLGISRQTILHYYRTVDFLIQAALLHTYGSDHFSKYPPATPRKMIANLITIANDISDSPGMTSLRSALEPRATSPLSSYHEFYRKRTETLEKFHDLLFSELGAQGQIKSELDPKLQAKAYTALWNGAKARSAYHGSDYPGTQQILTYVNKILREPLKPSEIPQSSKE